MINTTLCYIEQDGKYLMLHRVKKKNDINHDNGSESAVNLSRRKVRKRVCSGKHWIGFGTIRKPAGRIFY